MQKDKKYKILVMIIVILSVIIVGLITFIAYDNLLSPKDKISKSNSNEEKTTSAIKYEEIDEKEINELIESSRLSYYLNHQSDTVTDMNLIFEQNNYEMLENTVLWLYDDENPQTFIMEEDIKKEAIKLFGYDIKFNYIDLKEGDEVAFKWDESSRKYIVVEPSLYAHGSMRIDMEFKITDIKKNNDNSYDVTTRQLWSNEQSEGDYPERFYFSYEAALDDKDPVYTLQLKDDELGYDVDCFERAFDETSKNDKGGYYTYHLVKENGIIRIIQYIRNI